MSYFVYICRVKLSVYVCSVHGCAYLQCTLLCMSLQCTLLCMSLQCKIKRAGLVQSGPHHHLIENSLVLAMIYSCKIGEMALSNNHLLTLCI